MDLPVIMMVGGVTGWLASLLVKTDRMGAWASVAVGTVGSLLGFGFARALDMPSGTAADFAMIVVFASLTAAWSVGMARAALGVFFGWASWR